MIRTLFINNDPSGIDSITSSLKKYYKQIEIINLVLPNLVMLEEAEPNYPQNSTNNRDFELIFTTTPSLKGEDSVNYIAFDESLCNKVNLGQEKSDNLYSLSNQQITLADCRAVYFLMINDIIRCQSNSACTTFFIQCTGQKFRQTIKISILRTLTDLEIFLMNNARFYRVHEHHVVNVNHISKYIKDDGGYLIMDDDPNLPIPIARSQKENFLKYLRQTEVIL